MRFQINFLSGEKIGRCIYKNKWEVLSLNLITKTQIINILGNMIHFDFPNFAITREQNLDINDQKYYRWIVETVIDSSD